MRFSSVVCVCVWGEFFRHPLPHRNGMWLMMMVMSFLVLWSFQIREGRSTSSANQPTRNKSRSQLGRQRGVLHQKALLPVTQWGCGPKCRAVKMRAVPVLTQYKDALWSQWETKMDPLTLLTYVAGLIEEHSLVQVNTKQNKKSLHFFNNGQLMQQLAILLRI